MKPKKVTVESEREERCREFCDNVIHNGVVLMTEAGASVPMVLDRMLTYAMAESCLRNGSPEAARIMRHLAKNIEAGCFYPITGEGDTSLKN